MKQLTLKQRDNLLNTETPYREIKTPNHLIKIYHIKNYETGYIAHAILFDFKNTPRISTIDVNSNPPTMQQEILNKISQLTAQANPSNIKGHVSAGGWGYDKSFEVLADCFKTIGQAPLELIDTLNRHCQQDFPVKYHVGGNYYEVSADNMGDLA